MANPDHLVILKQGVEAWNKWRDQNKEIQPDLIDANLRGADLSGANLRDANLFAANLEGADLRWSHMMKANLFESNLSGARLFRADLSMANFVRANLFRANLCRAYLIRTNLSRANLCRANLKEAVMPKSILFGARLTSANLMGADLSEAIMSGVDLSGAIIDKETNLRNARDVVAGINGIYSPDSDSAALIVISPRGDSMLGPSSDAVVQSLTRARRYHGFSLTLAVVMMAILIIYPGKSILNLPGNATIAIDRLAVFSMIFTASILTFVKAFLEDALEGARCLRDRDSATIAGRFPWTLTRFTGDRLDKRALSFVSRTALALHPAAYLFVPWASVAWYIWVFGLIISVFCCWILLLSQQFQRPILFDSKTALHHARILMKRTDELEKLLHQRTQNVPVRKTRPSEKTPQLQARQQVDALDQPSPATRKATAPKEPAAPTDAHLGGKARA